MISSKKPNPKLFNYALHQLAISPKSKADLTFKLKRKRRQLGLADPVGPVIKKLIRLNFLDDHKFLDYFLRRHPLWSNRRLAYDLHRRHHLTFQPSPNTDLVKIKKIIAKKSITDQNKIFASLARLGFSLSDVKIAFDEFIKNR